MIFAKERKIQRKEEGDKLTGVKKEGRSLLLLRLWIHPHLCSCSCCSSDFERWGRANIWIKFQCRNKTLKIVLSERGGWEFRRGLGWGWGARWGRVGQSGAEKKKVLLDKQSSGAGKQPKVGGKGGMQNIFHKS